MSIRTKLITKYTLRVPPIFTQDQHAIWAMLTHLAMVFVIKFIDVFTWLAHDQWFILISLLIFQPSIQEIYSKIKNVKAKPICFADSRNPYSKVYQNPLNDWQTNSYLPHLDHLRLTPPYFSHTRVPAHKKMLAFSWSYLPRPILPLFVS